MRDDFLANISLALRRSLFLISRALSESRLSGMSNSLAYFRNVWPCTSSLFTDGVISVC